MAWLAWVVLLPLVATIDLNKLNLANRFSDHHHSYDDDYDGDYDNSGHQRLQQCQSCKPKFFNTIINMVMIVMIIVVIKCKQQKY